MEGCTVWLKLSNFSVKKKDRTEGNADKWKQKKQVSVKEVLIK